MTSELETNNRILELEGRVEKLEKLIENKDDVLRSNFEGYETLSPEEIKTIEEAEKEIERDEIRSLDEILSDLE